MTSAMALNVQLQRCLCLAFFLSSSVASASQLELSSSQQAAVTSSWEELATNNTVIKESGIVYCRIVNQRFPSDVDHFCEGFSNKSNTFTEVGLRRLILNFRGLGRFVACLNNNTCLGLLADNFVATQLAHDLGPVRFQEMRLAFPRLLDERLGDRISDNVIKGYDKLLSWIQDAIFDDILQA